MITQGWHKAELDGLTLRQFHAFTKVAADRVEKQNAAAKKGRR
jgi:hypothetical protein